MARIALAAGGTGGHVMPALALAEALREEAPGIDLLFFSGSKEQELRWYRAEGAEPVALPAAPLAGGWTGKARGLWCAWKSYRRARRILREWRAQAVVGLGGYVSGPCVLAGARLGLPTLIHEQNAVAGKTNRWLAPRVTAVATTYPKAFARAGRIRRLVATGNPIRRRVLPPASPAQGRERFGLDPERPTLLVCGGSQGAKRLNDALLEFLASPGAREIGNLQFLWIAGAANVEQVRERLRGAGGGEGRARLVPFIEDMGLAYAVSDVVLCRAGSASLAEAAAWGLPAIVVPLPWAADDHQRRNAEWFAKEGACLVVEERRLNARQLTEALASILGDPVARRAMSEAARRLARPRAARDLARLALEILRMESRL
ncbi:MAG: undecaprenyldiphospho-muramoylpentapeptide beta-N-acetylglucosaminyltransferase [Candidatus Sumerlaeota bacterium]|nr:undecaprenyldiphospho-muramoylpentapeptide beta-N-acetylglucosaminyltransferase [Candidatus Sumerlaeota bacterium]